MTRCCGKAVNKKYRYTNKTQPVKMANTPAIREQGMPYEVKAPKSGLKKVQTEIVIGEIDHGLLEKVVVSCYSSEIDVASVEELVDLLIAADRF